MWHVSNGAFTKFMFQSYGQENEQPTLGDITPVASHPQQKTRISDDVGTTSRDESHSRTLDQGMEEEGMEEMLDAFYELDPMVQQEGEVDEHQGVDAYREGKSKPIWLDAEEWEMIRHEYTDTREKLSQQREAARV